MIFGRWDLDDKKNESRQGRKNRVLPYSPSIIVFILSKHMFRTRPPLIRGTGRENLQRSGNVCRNIELTRERQIPNSGALTPGVVRPE